MDLPKEIVTLIYFELHRDRTLALIKEYRKAVFMYDGAPRGLLFNMIPMNWRRLDLGFNHRRHYLMVHNIRKHDNYSWDCKCGVLLCANYVK